MSELTESSKLVERKLVEAFGCKPTITSYLDGDGPGSVDIASASDTPDIGITSYSTVNLSDHPMYVGGREHETRVEIAGAAPRQVPRFANVISSAAFGVMNQKLACYPGVVFPDVISRYQLSATMRHVMFSEAYLWPRLDTSLRLPDRLVSWVLVIPIADSELEFANLHGWQSLGRILERHDIDVYDLQRKPVV